MSTSIAPRPSIREEISSFGMAWQNGFTPFQGSEESFLLGLISHHEVRSSLGVNFDRLTELTFALPHFHCFWQQQLPTHAPAHFLKAARLVYLSNIADNEERLGHIQHLARMFNEAQLKVVFVKGAAELVRFQDDESYLGCRSMHDLDVLCDPADLRAVDELMISKGYSLHRYDQPLNDQEIRDYSLRHFGHLVYEYGSERVVELHPNVSDASGYPDSFSSSLLDNSQQVDLKGTKVWVPNTDDMLVYFLCNAASRRDNDVFVKPVGVHLEGILGLDCSLSAIERLHRLIDVYQLLFLVRLSDLYGKIRDQVDLQYVRRMCHQSRYADLMNMHLNLASSALGAGFSIHGDVCDETINGDRNRYLAHYGLPLVAQQIERIVEHRVSEQIERQIGDSLDRQSKLGSEFDKLLSGAIDERISTFRAQIIRDVQREVSRHLQQQQQLSEIAQRSLPATIEDRVIARIKAAIARKLRFLIPQPLRWLSCSMSPGAKLRNAGKSKSESVEVAHP